MVDIEDGIMVMSGDAEGISINTMGHDIKEAIAKVTI